MIARRLLLAGLLVALATPALAHAGDKGLYTRSTKVMGTRVTLSIYTDDEVRAARATKAVFDEFERIDRLMTTWLDDSDVSRINAAAGVHAVAIDPEVLEVIRKAQAVARKTGGAFDITVGAFRGLWKFDEDRDGTIPDKKDVLRARALVDYRDIVIDPRHRTVKLRRKGQRITLGGIAKGYAVNEAVALLHERGLRDFILQAGGDLHVSGTKGDRKWRVGIRDPRGGREAPFAVAEIQDRTFSTSGDYERSVIADGVRYHHILDPATGFPATRSRSVTVMARDAFTADAWSTALFVLGHDKGLPLVEKMPDLEAVFVDAENNVHPSSGLKDKLIVLHPPTGGV